MPTITVEGPPIEEIGTKRSLVRALTDAAARAYGLPKEIIHVLIRENSPDNVGTAGQLLSDKRRT